ncbi:hypothetical protein RFI_01343 [Reticulomyxa filosa]|uniref:Uncharacterized protein n=1 Tax=Reticulomyxa filosa TaxID=46433 RepID=X6PCC5_RETFI|nr:hypothetical protein RFI_01343 [Reticulomyxa filosa]|eukprot:ETO35719.1 hypothetical protein RFI_01343 [Reticulomyxa filosa]
MKYVSVWSKISNKLKKLNNYNKWVPFTDNHIIQLSFDLKKWPHTCKQFSKLEWNLIFCFVIFNPKKGMIKSTYNKRQFACIKYYPLIIQNNTDFPNSSNQKLVSYWDRKKWIKVLTFCTFERLDEQWKIIHFIFFYCSNCDKIINTFFLNVFMD